MKQSQGRQRDYLSLRNPPATLKPRALDRRSTERLADSDAVGIQDGSLLGARTNLRIDQFGNDYKDGSHWTSVLHRATSSGDRDIELDDAQTQGAQLPIYQTVLLFDCTRQASEQELVAALPPRSICDELISSYFRLLDHCCKAAPAFVRLSTQQDANHLRSRFPTRRRISETSMCVNARTWL